jgi:hypothetical protein
MLRGSEERRMLTTIVAFALLAGSEGLPAVDLSEPRKPGRDPNRLVCKYSDEPGSRIQRRKVCYSAAEWAERKRIEFQYLLEKQYNGAK